MVKHIKWDIYKINFYLDDKFKKRGVDAREYEFLSEYIYKLKPETIIDVGCFLGVSTYILGTASPNIKNVYAIENTDAPSFCEYIQDGKPIPKEDYGKEAPEGAIVLRNGYESDLMPLLEKHPGAFVFLDSVKMTPRVLHELEICYKGKAKYVAMHDTSKYYKQIRRAMNRAIKLGWFKLIDEDYVDSKDNEKTKGVSLLERVE